MVIIVADTTSGLPRDLIKNKGIPLIPQIVIFGETSYQDDNEITTEEFLGKLVAAKELPKTAAPAPALYNPIFSRASANGESVIVVAPSAKVSGTVRAASIAAQDYPGADIRVVDSLTIAGNLGSLVLLADEWAKNDKDANEIEKNLNDWIKRGRLYFLVNTLEYLQKGGRIGGAKAILGELLQVKPILCVRDGQVEPFEQQRTKKRALARLIDIVETDCPKSEAAHLSVMQADAFQEAQELVKELTKRMGIQNIPIYELPPAIVVHGGPGALAVGFFVA